MIKFESTRLLGTGKKGIITPDQNGYFEICVGGLNIYNSMGEFYTVEGVRQLFEKSSRLMKNIQNGNLKSEEGHPKWTPGMTEDAWLRRLARIEEQNVCGHVSEVWLEEDYGKKNPKLDNSVVGIFLKIKPAGIYGPALESAFLNPKENVNFSIRGITNDYYHGRQCIRVLEEIYTWDRVSVQGLDLANKFDSPSLEDDGVVETLYSKPITHTAVKRAYNESCNSIAMESDKANLKSLLDITTPKVAKQITSSESVFIRW